MKTVVGLILGVVLLVGGGAALAFDETDLKKPKALNACEGQDLVSKYRTRRLQRGKAQRGRSLQGSPLWGKLEGADLSEVNLTGASLPAAILWNADLSGGQISPMHFSTGRAFGDADLSGSNLTEQTSRWHH